MVLYKQDMTSVNFSCWYHQNISNQFVYIETKQHKNQVYLLCNSSTFVVSQLHTPPRSHLAPLEFPDSKCIPLVCPLFGSFYTYTWKWKWKELLFCFKWLWECLESLWNWWYRQEKFTEVMSCLYNTIT